LAKGLNAEDSHKDMFSTYGGKCLSCKAVRNWVKKFSQGRSKVKVADDSQPRCPVEITTETTVQRGKVLIRADKRTTDSVATALGYSHGLAYNIMQDHLKFWKGCTQATPRELKDRETINQMGQSLQHLLWYADEEDTLKWIATGDES
jgi:hypothetical protein